MVTSPDVLGSVDWIVVEFPGSRRDDRRDRRR
jgi:hypothetical protein